MQMLEKLHFKKLIFKEITHDWTFRRVLTRRLFFVSLSAFDSCIGELIEERKVQKARDWTGKLYYRLYPSALNNQLSAYKDKDQRDKRKHQKTYKSKVNARSPLTINGINKGKDKDNHSDKNFPKI